MNRLQKIITWDSFPQSEVLTAKYGPWTGTLIELIADDSIDPHDRLYCATQPNMLDEDHRDTLIVYWACTNNDHNAITKFLNYLHHEQFQYIRNRHRADQYRDYSRVR